MQMTTKKVKITGKYGVRGGVGIRKKYLLATKTDKAKYVCPTCGSSGKISRTAKGIYECRKCKSKISGGAYRLTSMRGVKG
jgi:large subunit ribosomal protein L37Ae